jgi:hypothetical protein
MFIACGRAKDRYAPEALHPPYANGNIHHREPPASAYTDDIPQKQAFRKVDGYDHLTVEHTLDGPTHARAGNNIPQKQIPAKEPKQVPAEEHVRGDFSDDDDEGVAGNGAWTPRENGVDAGQEGLAADGVGPSGVGGDDEEVVTNGVDPSGVAACIAEELPTGWEDWVPVKQPASGPLLLELRGVDERLISDYFFCLLTQKVGSLPLSIVVVSKMIVSCIQSKGLGVYLDGPCE